MNAAMKNQQRITTLIKSVSGQANILTIPRIYISLLEGKIEAALLLSQCVYWSDRTTNPQGWFYKSYKEWEDEIGLSQFRVKNAAKELKKMGILETSLRRANKAPTIHYRVNISLLTDTIIKFLDNQETSQSDYEETQQSDYQETSQTLTETTTETTTETDGGEGQAFDLNVFTAYEQEIGVLTPSIFEALKVLEDDHTAQWVIAAMKVAAANNKRSLSYFTAILRRWAVEGYGTEFKSQGKNGKPSSNDDPLAGINQWLAEQEALEDDA